MNKDSKIFVTGHRGMVGSALVSKLQSRGFDDLFLRTRSELDLLDQATGHAFLAEQKPDHVFIAAAHHDPALIRPSDIRSSAADPSHARELLGWSARVSAEEVVARMCRAVADASKPSGGSAEGWSR